MPSFAFMKILESTPYRYDRGIRLLSRNRIDAVYTSIADKVASPGKRILDVGCGTANASIACARMGASVIGIDINAGMLEVARSKVKTAGMTRRIKFLEIGVAELQSYIEPSSIDACIFCLSFSELTENEQSYSLRAVLNLLKPGGMLIIADESAPTTAIRRFIHGLARAPQILIAYAVTQTSSHPIGDPTSLLDKTGFVKIKCDRIWSDSFMVLTAYRRE